MPRRLRENTKNFDNRIGRFKSFRFIPEFSQFTPVKEGDEIDVIIDDIGSRGDGIGRVGGFLIFVPESKMGEHVRVSRNFAVAERME